MKNKDYIIFLDMDQCICNFNKSFDHYFKMHIKYYEKKFGRKKLEYDLNKLGKKFWVELEPLPDALTLWNFCASNFEKLIVLSSPGVYDFSIEGKNEWLENFTKGSFVAIYDRDKYKYIDPIKKSILIDDYDKNINKWVAHGGIGILHIDAKTSIERLQELLDKEV